MTGLGIFFGAMIACLVTGTIFGYVEAWLEDRNSVSKAVRGLDGRWYRDKRARSEAIERGKPQGTSTHEMDADEAVRCWCQGCDEVKDRSDMKWAHDLYLCRNCWHELGVEPAVRSDSLYANSQVAPLALGIQTPNEVRDWNDFLKRDSQVLQQISAIE